MQDAHTPVVPGPEQVRQGEVQVLQERLASSPYK